MFREVDPTDQDFEPEAAAPSRLAVRSHETFDQDLADIAAMIHPAYEANPYLRMAFYGQPGVGKTWLAASFPNPIIIDCHEGGSKFLPPDRFKNVDVINTTELDAVERILWYLKEGKHSYKTAVIDTVTSLIEMANKYMRPQESTEPIVSRDPSMPSWRLWGQINQNVGDLLWHFIGLPMNVVFLAHERQRRDDDADADLSDEYAAPAIFPDMNPGTRKRLYGSVDIMGRMVMRELSFKSKEEGAPPTKPLSRVLYLKPSPIYQAKDRSDMFKTHIIDPTYAKLQTQLKKLQEVS